MASVVSWIGLALAVIGLGLVALMAVVGWIRRGDRARLQRLSETPVSSIRDALDGTVTKLRGRVVAGTEPLARPAFGGVPLVWYRADVAKLVSDVGWVDVFTDRGLADFFLEDGSGERARVAANEAAFATPLAVYSDAHEVIGLGEAPWTRHPLTPEIARWLESRVREDHTFQVSVWSLAVARPSRSWGGRSASAASWSSTVRPRRSRWRCTPWRRPRFRMSWRSARATGSSCSLSARSCSPWASSPSSSADR
jgi:hypothetical protein